jgi:hypothetical protein
MWWLTRNVSVQSHIHGHRFHSCLFWEEIFAFFLSLQSEYLTWQVKKKELQDIFLVKSVKEYNLKGCSVHITDSRNLWIMPLRWLQVAWYCTMFRVLLEPTCRVSRYPRQVIEVDALGRLRFIWTALPTVITLITIISLGTYNTSSWYIFLRDDATPLVHLSSLMTAVCLSLLTRLLHWTASFTDCFFHWTPTFTGLLSFYNFGLTA